MIRDLIKKTSRWAVDGPAFAHVARALEQHDCHRDRLRVLTYHRILPSHRHAGSYWGVISATPEAFARQVDFLDENYDVVSMESVLAAVTSGIPLPPRAVLLTFDDAYTDFEQYAWPILRERRLPVTLFVPTAYPDQPTRCFWWDRIYHACLHTAAPRLEATSLEALPLRTREERIAAVGELNDMIKSLPSEEALQLVDRVYQQLAPPPLTHHVLGWDALRRLKRAGVTLAAHTQTHPLLHRLPLASAVAEAVQSQEDLRREIGDILPVLAYPGGGHTSELADQLREAFTVAFTTRRGINEIGVTDLLRMERINVGRKTTVGSLRIQLLSCAHLLHRHRNAAVAASG